MERIKQALEKARAEREASLPLQSRGVPAADSAPRPAPAAATSIEVRYSQTRIFPVDRAVLKSNRLIAGNDDKEGLTAYKMLRTQVLQRMRAHQWKALAITSPAIGDGKTLTAANLAISLARELEHTVLLVDLDFRNPNVHKYFGLPNGAGIDDYLLDGRPLSEILLNPGIDRLVLLPAGRRIENSSEILGSPAMGNLVAELKQRYPSRLVLFDLPPLLAADDALAFSPHVDAFLLVLRDGKTTRTELEHSLDLLKNVSILGTVLNDSDEKISTYY